MDQLDTLTLSALQVIARKNNLDSPIDRIECIELIRNHVANKDVQPIPTQRQPDIEPSVSANAIPTNAPVGNTLSTLVEESIPLLCSLMQEMLREVNEQNKTMQTFIASTLSTRVSPTNTNPDIGNDSLDRLRNGMVNQPSSPEQSHRAFTSVSPSQAVQMLSSQIPEFGGQEDEDIEIWIRRIEQASRIHGVSSDISYLAASHKLVKLTRRWFDTCPDSVLESWINFKKALLLRFTRKLPMQVVIQKVEARKWISTKESFQDYATEKLILMRSLNPSDSDAIQYLVTGISNFSLRGVAASLEAATVDQFLQKMH